LDQTIRIKANFIKTKFLSLIQNIKSNMITIMMKGSSNKIKLWIINKCNLSEICKILLIKEYKRATNLNFKWIQWYKRLNHKNRHNFLRLNSNLKINWHTVNKKNKLISNFLKISKKMVNFSIRMLLRNHWVLIIKKIKVKKNCIINKMDKFRKNYQ